MWASDNCRKDRIWSLSSAEIKVKGKKSNTIALYLAFMWYEYIIHMILKCKDLCMVNGTLLFLDIYIL